MVNSNKSEDEIVEWIVNVEDPKESNRMMNRYISGVSKGNIDYKVRELAYIDPKPRANEFYKLYKEADDKGKKDLLRQSLTVGGIISKGEFFGEFMKLVAQDSELDIDVIMDDMGEISIEIEESRAPRFEELQETIIKAYEEKEEKEKNQ
jgi:hypothetical protein